MTTEPTISSHFLRLTGKAELPREIEMGNNYHVSLSGAVKSITNHDNEDGTVARMYTFKAIKVELLDELGETLKLKDTRSNSQRFRSLVYKYYINNAMTVEFDDFYDGVMNQAMFELPALIERYERRNR